MSERVKAIFDIDLILGAILGWFIFTLMAGMKQDYAGGLGKYLPLPRWIPGTLDQPWIKTDNIITYAVTLLGIFFMKGRIQKILIYAFWSEIVCHIYGHTQ